MYEFNLTLFRKLLRTCALRFYIFHNARRFPSKFKPRIALLLLCGDISLNPGPVFHRGCKFHSSILLQLERLSIGSLLNNTAFSKLHYWYTNFFKLAVRNTSVLFSKSGYLPLTSILINLIVWFLKSLSSFPELTNPHNISVLVLLMMPPKMICLMMPHVKPFTEKRWT